LLLEVRELETAYGASQVLFGVGLAINPGEVSTLLGRNGMGKTTTVRSILGLTKPLRGSIAFRGKRIEREAPDRIARMGIALVPEGRQIFPNLSVHEHLLAFAENRASRPDPWTPRKVFDLFPRLAERSENMGNQLSGGEQQMLAIGRCLMSDPELIMFDEPSLGLAPALVQSVLTTVRDLNRDGLTCVLVEQNVAVSLKLASHAYVLENGRITLAGSGEQLLRDDRVRQAYLGL